MAKKIEGYIKLQIPAGKANPSPPVGPALGQRGLNIMQFCKEFNAATQQLEPGMPIPVVITAFSDRSFTFVTKTPPASYFLKKAAKIEKGSKTTGIGSFVCLVFALQTLILSDTIVLSFSYPLWSIVIAALFLGERVRLRRTIATVVGVESGPPVRLVTDARIRPRVRARSRAPRAPRSS